MLSLKKETTHRGGLFLIKQFQKRHTDAYRRIPQAPPGLHEDAVEVLPNDMELPPEDFDAKVDIFF